MTRDAYITQNAKGWEGDSFLGKEVERLCKQFNINHIIETGTFRGYTTKQLAKLAPVYTVEIVPENYEYAKENLKGLPVTIKLGNSVDALREWLPNLKKERLFFFLDAHWQQYNPLLDELHTIAINGIKPVIAIHDFKVPGKPFGFDSYAGQDYDLAWIDSALKEIYGTYRYHYNSEAEGAMRGVIFIYP